MVTTGAAITIAALGFLFIVPTETGLSFAATTPTNDGSNNNDKGNGDGSGQQKADQGQQDQQQTQGQGQQKTPVRGSPENPDQFPQLPIHHHPWWWKPIVIVQNHHTTTTKTVHDRNLTITQQNCIAGALQLGFSSNDTQNRANATYAAILGCFGQQ